MSRQIAYELLNEIFKKLDEEDKVVKKLVMKKIKSKFGTDLKKVNAKNLRASYNYAVKVQEMIKKESPKSEIVKFIESKEISEEKGKIRRESETKTISKSQSMGAMNRLRLKAFTQLEQENMNEIKSEIEKLKRTKENLLIMNQGEENQTKISDNMIKIVEINKQLNKLNDDLANIEASGSKASGSQPIQNVMADTHGTSINDREQIGTVENTEIQKEVNKIDDNNMKPTQGGNGYARTFDIDMNGNMIINEPVENKQLQVQDKILQIQENTEAGKKVMNEDLNEKKQIIRSILEEEIQNIRDRTRQEVANEIDDQKRQAVKLDGASEGQIMYMEYLKSLKRASSIFE